MTVRRAALLLLIASATAHAQTPATAAEVEGKFVRALTAMAIDDFETARRSLDEVLGEVPDDASVLTVRAEVATALGAPADAVFFARRATEAAPDRAQTWLAFAQALREGRQPTEAATALARALRLSPADPDVLLATADLAAERGDDGAEREALQGLIDVGDTVGARLRLSALAERRGDAADALHQAQAALRLAPSEPTAQRRLAALQGATPSTAEPVRGEADGPALMDAGRVAEAADMLLAEIDNDPRQIDRWALALEALAQLGDERAGPTADDALLLFPSVPSVLVGAAEAYASAGRLDEARDAAQRAVGALDLLGADLPDAATLRARLDALPSR